MAETSVPSAPGRSQRHDDDDDDLIRSLYISACQQRVAYFRLGLNVLIIIVIIIISYPRNRPWRPMGL
jgi:hypothetical protein